MPLIRIQDILDILIMSVMVYLLYSWFKRSRAIHLLGGLGVVIAIFLITRHTGLQMTSWVFQQMETVMIVLVIVVFQNEIRHALYRFSMLKDLLGAKEQRRCNSAEAVSDTIFGLASERTGAIIVFQRQDLLDDHLLHGVKLDADLSAPLLRSIFLEGTPLHDGAVLIRDGRLITASCLLPLSDSTNLPQHFGTRHRAALGLSERTDAVVVVISEERGEVSIATGDQLQQVSTPEEMKKLLQQLLTPASENSGKTLTKVFFRDPAPKAAILLGVAFVWLILSFRQGEVAIVPTSLTFHSLPENLALSKVTPEEINVRVRSISALAPPPSQLNLSADIDLSSAEEGNNNFRISTSLIRVPSGISIVGIEPSSIKVTIRKPPPKNKQ